jgi:chemotaxis protein methyltransferase CheR
VLAQARTGVFPLARADEIPRRYREAYMLRGTGSQLGRMRADPRLRSLVRFQALNLNDAEYAIDGHFDLILCRNVLIYFDGESRAGVVDRLISRLAPGGYLLLGHSESLREVSSRVRLVAPTIYTHAEPGSRA